MLAALTGPIGSGKSSALLALAGALKEKGMRNGGVISICDCRKKAQTAYSLLTLSTGETHPLARTGPAENDAWIPYCAFSFSRKALKTGNDEILRSLRADVLIIDEIGFWELSGGGWGEHLHRLQERSGPTVLGLRQGTEKELARAFGFSIDVLLQVKPTDLTAALADLLTVIRA